MIVTRKALPRRTLLRGAGATLVLPFLDAMMPALATPAVRAATAPPLRMGFFEVPNGVYAPFWRPTGAGKSFELSPILTPLASVRDRMVIVSGLGNQAVRDDGGGPHARANACWLTGGINPKHTEGADIESATSADQVAADVLGRDTILRSLEIATETASVVVGSCESGYSCAYTNTSSWRTPTSPNPMENNPKVVFERLFGSGGSPEARRAETRKDRSILDFVREDAARLKRRVGGTDRTTIVDYLDAVRDVERRIQITEQRSATVPSDMVLPAGIPESYSEHLGLMYDLVFLAYRADITRISTFQIARELSNRAYPEIGVVDGHHSVSHHGKLPERLEPYKKVTVYHTSLFAKFVEKLAATPEGDGSLLDHSMLLYGFHMSDGDLHYRLDLPLVLMGGGNGRVQGGRHLEYPLDTPMANLLLTMLHKAGVPAQSFGTSTGDLADL